jgi:hypothetical protein
MWLRAIVASLRYVARLKVKDRFVVIPDKMPELSKLLTHFGVRQAKYPKRRQQALPRPPTPLGHLVRQVGSGQIPKNPGIRENGAETAEKRGEKPHISTIVYPNGVPGTCQQAPPS